MSRYPVTVRSTDRSDDTAIIGYDPPMRTYFLQAFEDPDLDDLDLWLGTKFDEFPDLASLISAAEAKGYVLEALADQAIADMAAEAAKPHDKSLAERLGWPIR